MHYDLIIIGAGPGGSMAARTAARSAVTALTGGDGNYAYNDFWLRAVNYFSPGYRHNTKQVKSLPPVLTDAQTDTLIAWTEDKNLSGVPDDCPFANRVAVTADLPGIAQKIFTAPPKRTNSQAA